MSRSPTITDSITKYTVASLIGLFFVFAGAYGYFLQQTVNAVVQRSEISKQITQLRSQIGDAEQKYGAEIGSATLEKARELGFQTVDRSRYVARRNTDNTLLTLNVRHNSR